MASAPYFATGNWVGGAIVFASTVATYEALDTGEGRQLIRRIGKEVFDDVFGMSPSTAQKASTLTVHMAVNTATQFALGQVVAQQKITKTVDYNAKNPEHVKTATDLIRNGGGTNYGGRALQPDEVYQILYSGDKAVGLTIKAFYGQHIGITLAGLENTLDLAAFTNHPFQALGQGYFSIGTSHQAVNTSLLQAGYGTTVGSLGVGWTNALTTFVYGPYGGGLTSAIQFTRGQAGDASSSK